MGKMLGVYADDEELDRPDLNKCPWCGCFFASDTCTICGRICPEEMRAGNRAPVKKQRRRKRSDSGRVTFMAWYHSWWFILIMMFVMPVAGIILLATSPYRKSVKVTVIVIIVAYLLLSSVGLGRIIALFKNLDQPVDTSLSREDYIALCEDLSPEDFYREPSVYKDAFVTMTLVVKQRVQSLSYYDGEAYSIYYLCEDPEQPSVVILIRDCIQDGDRNYLGGDCITVYGEGQGEVTLTDTYYETYIAPCLYVAYVE